MQALEHVEHTGENGLLARIHLSLWDTCTYLKDPPDSAALAQEHYDKGLRLHGMVTGEAP